MLFPRTPDPGNIFAPSGRDALLLSDVIDYAREGKYTHWSRVSRSAIHSLLEYASVELDVPPSMLCETEYRQPLQFMGGHTLASVYSHVKMHRERNGRNIIALIQDTVGIEVAAPDIVTAIRKGKKIAWKLVPRAAAADVLRSVAESLDVPPSMLTHDDLQHPNAFLRGGTLRGILTHSLRHPERGERAVSAFILQDLGFSRKASDIIAFVRSKDNPNVQWTQAPWPEIHALLTQAAAERGIPANMLTSREMAKTKFHFLDGATLKGLTGYWLRRPEKQPDETTMQFMRRKLSLPEPARGSRARFRFSQMLGCAAEGQRYQDTPGITQGAASPWVSAVGRIYTRRFLSIDKQEIENEIILFMNADDARSIVDDTVRLSALHKHLETYVNTALKRWYEEMLLSSPLQRHDSMSSQTIIDKIEDRPLANPTSTALSPSMAASLASLTPHQKQLVIGIVVDGWSFEEMAAELHTDVDGLAEQYDDALAIMKIALADANGQAPDSAS